MALITARGLSVSIGAQQILSDLDFSLDAGSWIGLIGPNGSGKTTLLRTVSGLQRYTGELTLGGRAVSAWKARSLARHMAFVRQSTPLSFDFTVREVVLLGRSPHKGWLDRTTREDAEHARRALERVDMRGFAARSMLSLSGGERQRVFLAQALVQEADLLLLDEPTNHLDVRHRYAFLHTVRALVDGGRTAFAVFHDIELAARFVDWILVLDGGRLVVAGKPQEVVTKNLLADVFRIRASLAPAQEGALSIHYIGPTT